VSKTSLSQKKSHVMEIQINGGSIKDKVDFGYKLFEQQVRISLRRRCRIGHAAMCSAERGVWRLGWGGWRGNQQHLGGVGISSLDAQPPWYPGHMGSSSAF